MLAKKSAKPCASNSGACTTEIAAFDEFAALLAGEGIDGGYDHIRLGHGAHRPHPAP